MIDESRKTSRRSARRMLAFGLAAVMTLSIFSMASWGAQAAPPPGPMLPDITIQGSDLQAGSHFGRSIATCDDILVVGMPGYDDDITTNDCGKVYIYDTVSATLLTSITSIHSQQGGYFGESVAIAPALAADRSGQYLILVGAPYEDVDAPIISASAIDAGWVYAYYFDPSDSSMELAGTYWGDEADASFGYSVATDGSYIVIGEPDASYGELTDFGFVHVFPQPYSSSLPYVISSPSQLTYGTTFGRNVAASDGKLIVGDPNDGSGKVFVYTLGVASSEYITLSSPAASKVLFGQSLAARANKLVVGSNDNYVVGHKTYNGVAYLYDLSTISASSIPVTIKPVAKTLQKDSGFGRSVAYDPAVGVVVGAPNWDASRKTLNAGAVFYYDTTGTFKSMLTSPTPEVNGVFGFAVAAASDDSYGNVFAGGPNENVVGSSTTYTDAGEVYEYHMVY